MQFAESMPGGIQLFARALNVSEAELFKMMEQGKVLASDVLPKVAVEMNKVANSAGALEQKYKTTRVAQGRFFKELETSQKKVFKQGFDESMANLLNTLADELNASETGMRGLAKTFRLVFNTIANVAKVVMPVLNDLSTAIGFIADGFDAVFGSKLGKWVLGIGVMTAAMYKLSQAANVVYLRIAAILGIITELVALFTSGYAGGIEAALGVDINLTKIPVIADLYKMSKEDSPMGKFISAMLDLVTVLLSILIPLRLMGVKFTDMWKQISKLADKIRAAAGGSKNATKTTGTTRDMFEPKERKRISIGDKVDSGAKSFLGSLMTRAYMLANVGMPESALQKGGLLYEYQKNNPIQNNNGTNIYGDIKPTIEIKSDNPDVIKRTMDDWFNSITINNAAAGG